MAKILVVEDDPVMNRMYRKIFSYEGHEVVMAENGEDGFLKLKTFIPDLIVLDVMMPKMNGLEMLDLLKSNPKTSSILVVLLTNLGVQEEIDKALTRGAIKYITKADHEPRKVVDMVNQVLAENIGLKKEKH